MVATSAASGTTLTGLNPLRFTFLLPATVAFLVVDEHESEEHMLFKDTLLCKTVLGICGGRCGVFTLFSFFGLGSSETVTLFPAGFKIARGCGAGRSFVATGIVGIYLFDLKLRVLEIVIIREESGEAKGHSHSCSVTLKGIGCGEMRMLTVKKKNPKAFGTLYPTVMSPLTTIDLPTFI